MPRKNRILSLIDFSEYSETILRFTRSFSTYLQADVVLIHQLPGIVPARASAHVREQFYKAEREDAYERFVALAGSVFDTMPAMIASEQELSEMLQNLKNETYFDWLFIGLKGTSFLEQMFLGSKAVGVLEETDFVSVAMPLSRELYFPKELVVAVHPEYPFERHQLKAVITQLSGGINKLTFLSVTTDKKSEADLRISLSRLAAAFDGHDTATVVFNSTDKTGEIERYMKAKQDSYLVVQETDPSIHDFIFKKGLVNELVYKSSVPMIVLPYSKQAATGPDGS